MCFSLFFLIIICFCFCFFLLGTHVNAYYKFQIVVQDGGRIITGREQVVFECRTQGLDGIMGLKTRYGFRDMVGWIQAAITLHKKKKPLKNTFD